MSNPPTEPENAAHTALVRHEQGHKNTWDGDHNKSQRWTPTSRNNSASLLTQELALTYELGGVDPNTLPLYESPEGGTGSAHSFIATPENRHNEVNAREHSADEMTAIPAPVTVSSTVTALSLGATPTSTPITFNLHDMNHVNSLLMSHREFLNTARERGISLERTEKEKRVQEHPKGTVSTNLGDTGMNRPTTPLPTSPLTASESTLAQPPNEDLRARYRSWRDARPGMAAEKAWSIGDQGADNNQGGGGQVEKSITEALAGVEPNNRSRKASHSLRFFREGLPEEKPKKRDNKGRGRSKEGIPHSKGSGASEHINQKTGEDDRVLQLTGDIQRSALYHSVGAQSSQSSPLEGSRSKLPSSDQSSNKDVGAQDGYFDTLESTDTYTIAEEQKRILPAPLLADIRKHHNLTPGAAKGSSFSCSIPVTESERPNPANEDQEAELENQKGDYDAEVSPVKGCDDEEESGEEQISSALFVPHQTPHELPDQERAGLEGFNRTQLGDQHQLSDSSQEWLEEHEIPSRDVDQKYYSEEIRSQQPSTLGLPPSSLTDKESFLSKTSELSDVDQDIHDEGGYTTKGEESSLTDDADTTPTGSLVLSNHLHMHHQPHIHDHQQKPKQPLEAIELIPYRHQVGGHTTMWRFSKRAVCKQLNNRENEFYEKVERYHPQLLKFLPRYIGVLNVTFEKQQRRKLARKDGNGAAVERGKDPNLNGVEDNFGDKAADSSVTNGHASPDHQPTPARMISQSLQSTQVPIPTVTFADNRHIIPTSFLQPQPQPIDLQHRSKSDGVASAVSRRGLSQSQPPLPDSEFTFRPTLSDKHAASWGATTVNKKLRNEVFGEAFLRHPIPIHRHKKPASQHRSLPSRHGSSLRASNSESSLATVQQSQSSTSLQPAEESNRRRAVKTAAQRRSGLSPLTPAHAIMPIATGDGPGKGEGEVEFEEKSGRSAPEPEISRSQEIPKGKRQRRYSSGGLRRKPAEVAHDRGNLKYFEEADEAGYKGDVEEGVFKMDPEPSQETGSPSATTGQKQGPMLNIAKDEKVVSKLDATDPSSTGTMPPTSRNESSDILAIPRPVNPKEAQTQRDSRVEYFLLLEDLTAGMKRPCIMDLKMGTRQYGVEANEKKQKSQRSKCESTTSKELGVRVCGLQVWDVESHSYVFQDKYFGRDLKAGREFQDALKRFLYDGVDYSSVLRHIPTILHKLSQLEVLIRGLIGYRFYAASLLMFYDGDTQDEDESDSTALDKERKRKKKDIDFKIADFANCVTKEDVLLNQRPCPPQHPDMPDNGFLRGLRSLRTYFLAIQKEIQGREMGRIREDWGNGVVAVGHDGSEYGDDEGGISY